jgi:hypothetical protein
VSVMSKSANLTPDWPSGSKVLAMAQLAATAWCLTGASGPKSPGKGYESGKLGVSGGWLVAYVRCSKVGLVTRTHVGDLGLQPRCCLVQHWRRVEKPRYSFVYHRLFSLHSSGLWHATRALLTCDCATVRLAQPTFSPVPPSDHALRVKYVLQAV